MATVNTSFNPGFVQATSLPSEQTQTFATSPSATSQTFGISDVPTRSGFMGSLAPTGQGKSSTSTVPTFKDTSSSSSSDFGTVAKVGGGITLAMLLNSMGSGGGGGGGGGGVSITGVLGGLSKVAKLAKMAGVDVEKYVNDIFESLNSTSTPTSPSGEMENLSKWLNPDGPKIPFETTTGSSQFEAANELARLNAQPPPSTNQLANPDMYPNVTAPLSQAAQNSVALFNSGTIASTATVNSANAAALGIDTFGGLGVPASTITSTATVGTGLSTGLNVAGAEFGAGAFSTGPGIGLGALAGPLAIVGLFMMAKSRSDAKKDPTANARYANRLENIYQDITSGKTTEQEGLDNLLEIARSGRGAHSVEVMRRAAENDELPFSGMGGTSGGTKIVGWSPASAELYEKFEPALKRGVWEGEKFKMEPQGQEQRTLSQTPRLTEQNYEAAGFAAPIDEMGGFSPYDAVHPDARARQAARYMDGDSQTGLAPWADFLSNEEVKERQMMDLHGP